MFGIGVPEIIIILAVALIVIGPKKLPDLAKTVGRAMGELKKATTDFKESIKIDDELKDVKKAFDDMNKDIRETVDIKIGAENIVQDVSTPPDDKKGGKEEETAESEGLLKR